MRPMTDTSDAWDREGEREDARQERRDAIHAELTGDYETLANVIVEAFAGFDKPTLIKALAYSMAANWATTHSVGWFAELRNSLENDDEACVSDIIDAEIAARLIIEGDKP